MQDAVGEAARRYARLQAPDCSDSERAEIAGWRRADVSHERAWRAVAGLDAGLQRHAAQDTRLQRLADEAWHAGGRSPAKTWQPAGWLVPAAAAMLLAAMASLVSLGVRPEAGAPPLVFSAEQEPRRFVLDDGSVMKLDLGSTATVRFGERARSVTLEAGRAVFDVSADPRRPFRVDTASGSAVAVGTRFQVDLAGGLAVVLEQGAVDLVARGVPGRQRLAPGEQARLLSNGSGWRTEPVDAQALTSWARGRHVFRARPLGEALTEINRYSATPVRLGDPLIADLAVSGSFVAGDSRMIVAALTEALPLRAVDAGNELVLFASYGDRRSAQNPAAH